MAMSRDLVLSNAHIYREIAFESLRSAESALSAHTKPKSDGSAGSVLSYDPTHRSFKDSMVAIVFAGMYLEALFWLRGCERFGKTAYQKVDGQPLEKRLAFLGVGDEELLKDVEAYRITRKALVHEKALPLSADSSPTRVAQQEAGKAIALVQRVETALAKD